MLTDSHCKLNRQPRNVDSTINNHFYKLIIDTWKMIHASKKALVIKLQ